MLGQQAIIFIPFALHIYRVYIVGRGLEPSAPPASLVKERWRRIAGGIPACCRLLSFNHPVGAGHARPARFASAAIESPIRREGSRPLRRTLPIPDTLPFSPPGKGRACPARTLPKAAVLTPATRAPTNHPGHISFRPRGISRALKTARGAVFAPRYAGRGARAFRFPHSSTPYHV